MTWSLSFLASSFDEADKPVELGLREPGVGDIQKCEDGLLGRAVKERAEDAFQCGAGRAVARLPRPEDVAPGPDLLALDVPLLLEDPQERPGRRVGWRVGH